eukprot:GHVS01108142.1.p1 GENE.GHVS01108142.1~~GHVS01108142.1.p1  ORF type:complete len:266 (+),score=43.66 GHVS01108142.1:245-1042(+)
MASSTSTAGGAVTNADLSWLPSDTDEQLALSFRIISNAYRTRVNALEADTRTAKAQLNDKMEQLTSSQKKTSALEVQLIECTQRANQLAEENRQLVATVKKLQKDNYRLECLKKAVMNSIQDDRPVDNDNKAFCSAEDLLQRSAPRTMQELNNTNQDYLSSPWIASVLNTSVTSVPDTPPNLQTTTSATLLVSNDGNRVVDGKAFFRAARAVLSSEQFNSFLTNIKKLNQQRITRDEALKQAQIIFGESGGELYKDFKAMLCRHQ